mmetsp:Transcript_47737/g.107555  ORF Transcript_47737/g.107555 Transcript_47737/m.107555 type:complete len:255 (-) Transcript_47737:1188-1952(-)
MPPSRKARMLAGRKAVKRKVQQLERQTAQAEKADKKKVEQELREAERRSRAEQKEARDRDEAARKAADDAEKVRRKKQETVRRAEEAAAKERQRELEKEAHEGAGSTECSRDARLRKHRGGHPAERPRRNHGDSQRLRRAVCGSSARDASRGVRCGIGAAEPSSLWESTPASSSVIAAAQGVLRLSQRKERLHFRGLPERRIHAAVVRVLPPSPARCGCRHRGAGDCALRPAHTDHGAVVLQGQRRCPCRRCRP